MKNAGLEKNHDFLNQKIRFFDLNRISLFKSDFLKKFCTSK